MTFLGAGAPVVKGLEDPVFAEPESGCERIDFVEERVAPPAPDPSAQAAKIEAFCERLRGEGRLLPAWEEKGLPAFLAVLDDEKSRRFSSVGNEMTARAWFREFLEMLSPAVPMGEAAPMSMSRPAFAEPTDSRAFDPESVALHQRVCLFRGARPETSYAEALREVACAGR